jgi:apolipoprotein N-acyltransferase
MRNRCLIGSTLREFCKSIAAFLGPLASGVMLAASFRVDNLSCLAWIGLVPIASALSRRSQLLATYLGAGFGGLAFNLITVDWMRTLDGGQGLVGPSAPNWMRQAEALAIFWPVTIYLGRTFIQAVPFLPMSVSLPLIWLCHESLVRYVSILIDETGWPFYFLGYSTAPRLVLSQVVDISGVSTASMLVACINGGLWDVWNVARRWRSFQRRKIALVRAFVVPSLVLMASYGYGAWQLAAERVQTGPSVMLMSQSSLDSAPERDACVANILKRRIKPDLTLWSEGAYHRAVSVPRDATPDSGFDEGSRVETTGPGLRALEQVARKVGASMVLGCARVSDTHRFNSSIFIDSRKGFLGYYDKVHLVPGREFIPSTVFFSSGRGVYEPGTEFPVFTLRCLGSGREFPFAISICYDIAFPEMYRRYMRTARGAPDYFVVCSSEGSDASGQLARDLLTMARFRAIESRRALVRNVYCGYSGIIDSVGRLEMRDIDWQITKPTFIGTIPIDSRNTLFVALGDWLSIASACVVAGAFVVRSGRTICFATMKAIGAASGQSGLSFTQFSQTVRTRKRVRTKNGGLCA